MSALLESLLSPACRAACASNEGVLIAGPDASIEDVARILAAFHASTVDRPQTFSELEADANIAVHAIMHAAVKSPYRTPGEKA